MGLRAGTIRWTAALGTAALLALGAPAAAHADTAPAYRTDLRILVIDDGGPSVAAITAELTAEGVPFTEFNYYDHTRPTVDAAFLTGTLPDGTVEAKYQGVVLPAANALGIDAAEAVALSSYERTYNIRQLDASSYPQPSNGLNWPQNPGYLGALDGMTAQVTPAGSAAAFGYLQGGIPIEDNNPSVTESYGFLSTPLTSPATGSSFTPLVQLPIPGSTAQGSLVGDYHHNGHDELVTTFAYNQYQRQWRLLARGMVDWLTQGVHLGFARNYLSVQVQDVLLSDNRWNSTLKCTSGDVNCTPVPGSPEAAPIRMTPADVTYAQQWEAANNLTLDLAYDGSGSEAVTAAAGSDPLAAQFAAQAGSFRWLNGGYGRQYLGCVQNTAVVPWVCSTDANGAVQWVSQADITSAVQTNTAWARAKGLPVDAGELVTSQYSGLALAPQQPQDNPALAPALTALGVSALASDGSAESAARQVGSATTVPGHPLDLFHNVATAAGETDEYNWTYTSAAQGGSGACTNSTTSTCLAAPLDTTTGFGSTIVPSTAAIALQHVLTDDPSPLVLHQAGLTEDRIAYPVLDQVLSGYRALFAATTPVVNLRLADLAAQQRQQAAWRAALAVGTVTAYQVGQAVTVTAPAGVAVPVTAPSGSVQVQPAGTAATAAGTAYAGELSGWLLPASGEGTVTVQLPSPAAPQALAPNTRAARSAPARSTATAPVTAAVVPASVARPVPLGPGDQVRIRAGKR
ncbi:hypothetical protein C7C46_11880 [Streptomyces tateyamensis]|uniref:Uncharacterized protein n=1 Tax=Streptomyces tateyamensis TaxID=565073 RepID=A0A2V4NVI8_9ACTN|nr:hypothetical protein [Streptomyces tateyamensis]PYC80840.1 hypothetical protein C7C46_11880 [Streptomyces tateyamensis]